MGVVARRHLSSHVSLGLRLAALPSCPTIPTRLPAGAADRFISWYKDVGVLVDNRVTDSADDTSKLESWPSGRDGRLVLWHPFPGAREV